MKIIGDRLKALRASVQFSQTKIAKMFGTAQSSIFKYESGVSTVPAEIMLKYADYFDVSMDFLYGRTEECTMPVRRRRSKSLIRKWTGLSRCASTPVLP